MGTQHASQPCQSHGISAQSWLKPGAGLLTTQCCAGRCEGGWHRTRGFVPVQVDVVQPLVWLSFWDWEGCEGWVRQVGLPAAPLACIPHAGEGEPPAWPGNSPCLRWKCLLAIKHMLNSFVSDEEKMCRGGWSRSGVGAVGSSQ